MAEQSAIIAQQQKGMEVLTAQLKEQAAQIQKVSAQLEVRKPAAQIVVMNNRRATQTRRVSRGRMSRAPPKSKDNLEEFNAVPFSRVIRVEQRTLYPCAVARRRPRIKHLEWITAIA